MENATVLPQPASEDVADSGLIKVGSCGRHPLLGLAQVADRRRIRLGGGFRLPAER